MSRGREFSGKDLVIVIVMALAFDAALLWAISPARGEWVVWHMAAR